MYVTPIPPSTSQPKCLVLMSCRDQFTCNEGKTCANNGALGIFGCFLTAQPSSATVDEGAASLTHARVYLTTMASCDAAANLPRTCINST